jgi:glycosyltransferase involved in cell wall biosynthesis
LGRRRVKVALLKGNRYNPWHLRAYRLLEDECSFTAFRAESEIQRHMALQDDGSIPFPVEPIWYDTQRGPVTQRALSILLERYRNRTPRIQPFYDRLKGFDVLHTWELFSDWSAEAVFAKEKYGIPVVAMVWDNIVFNMEKPNYRRQIKERVIRSADIFLAHTERTKRTLVVEGVPEDRIVVFPPAVDTETFAPGQGNRADFGLRDDEIVILYVGWLIERKGVDFLLVALHEMFADPALKTKRLRLVLAGSPAHKPRIEAIMNRLGVRDACTFIGPLSYGKMPELFRCADIFVLPSVAFPDWQEQFGMSLIEAMACGVPVVSTHSGAIPEILGDCGVLCQPADFVSLHAALKRLILDDAARRHYGDLGRARALDRFQLAPHAQMLRDTYHRVVK